MRKLFQLLALYYIKYSTAQLNNYNNGLAGPLVTELHNLCSPQEGKQARCGPSATCLLIGGVPTCHCIRDVASGLPLAGNPYRGCTWDISGIWELQYHDDGTVRDYYTGIHSDSYIFKVERTDAVLKTRYITGNIFVISAISPNAVNIVTRAFVDVNDNISVIFEAAEGFVDQHGRFLYFQNSVINESITRCYPNKNKIKDPDNLKGGWKKPDGSKIKIHKFGTKGVSSNVINKNKAYWYNDDSFGIPHIRLSTALFVDETLDFERRQFQTTDRFIQLGWYGMIGKGINHIYIISPYDGKPIFLLRRVQDKFISKPNVFTSSSLLLEGDEVYNLKEAVDNAVNYMDENEKFDVMSRQLTEIKDIVHTGGDRVRILKQIENQDQSYPVGEIFSNSTYYIAYKKNKKKRLLEKIAQQQDVIEQVMISKNSRKLQGIFDRIVTPEAAKMLNRPVEVNNQEEATTIFNNNDFFGIKSDVFSPYDYLYIKPAKKLLDAEKELDSELQREYENPLRRIFRRN